jgi:hypothetical protein
MLYSVWNVTKQNWATSTNYSTEAEASALMARIVRACKDEYIVKGRKFGSIGGEGT